MKLKNQIRKILAAKRDQSLSPSIHYITKDRDKLSKQERNEISKEMKKEGLDGNGRFKKIDHGLQKLHAILKKHDIEIDEVLSSDKFRQDSGRDTFDVARQTQDPHEPIPIKKSKVVFTWHLLHEKAHKDSDVVKDKTYEILSYMS